MSTSPPAGFEGLQTALREAIPAAQELGLSTGPAEAILGEAAERMGLSADVYVVALVGGTGVGKSTLLNALAGSTVSPAGVRRPTTGSPVAWVPAASIDGIRPLLARLGVTTPQIHAAPGLERVVILDLPDVDSLELGHRAVVEELLPKVDVVAWVTDPEKYADGVLHDGFLRRWLPRLERQIIVLNKVDRLDGKAADAVARDLAALVAAELPRPGGTLAPGTGPQAGRRPWGVRASDDQRAAPVVITTSAAAGETGVTRLRSWLAEAVDAKAVIAARLAAAVRTELGDLATAAGVIGGFRPLVPASERSAAVEQATQAVLRVIDIRGAEKRAVDATRAVARRRGTGPAGLITSTLLRLSGRGGPAAQPAEYLRSWRGRGGLAAAGEAIRAAVLTALADLPAPLRSRYALAQTGDVEQRLAAAVDRAVGRQGDVAPPTSGWWPLLGLLQTATQLLLALVAAWIVVWFIVRPTVPDVVLPVVGPVPAPLVLLAAALLIGYLLARLLALHAGWLGRRWAGRITRSLQADVARTLEEAAFAPLDRLEAARERIAAAVAAAGVAAAATASTGPAGYSTRP